MPKKPEKEELFCREYIISLDVLDAYLKAGYSDKKCSAGSNAYKYFQKPSVQARIKELKEARNKRLDIKADDVLKDLFEIKERCMQHKPVMYFDKVKKEYVQETAMVKHEDGTVTQEGIWTFDASNSLKAIDTLIKHFVVVPKDATQGVSNEPEINTVSNLDDTNI